MSERAEELNEVTKLGELADDAKIGKLRDREKLAVTQGAADIVRVMETPWGRRVIASIIKKCRVGEIPFYDSDRNTVFALGNQNIGHWLVARLREDCIGLMREMEDEERDATRNRN